MADSKDVPEVVDDEAVADEAAAKAIVRLRNWKKSLTPREKGVADIVCLHFLARVQMLLDSDDSEE